MFSFTWRDLKRVVAYFVEYDRYEEVLERLPSVWNSYMSDGWLQLAAETLRRVYVSAWRAGKV